MGRYLVFVENKAKAETIKFVAGDQFEVVVLEDCPASFSFKPQGQSGASVFAFQPVASVWLPVLEHIGGYRDIYYGFDTNIDGEYLSYLVEQLLLTSALNVQGHRLNLAGFTDSILAESPSLIEPLSDARCVRHLQHDLFHKVFFSHLSRLIGTTEGPGHVELSIATLALFSMLGEKHQSQAQVVRQQRWEVEVQIQQDDEVISGHLTEMYGVTSDGSLDSGELAQETAIIMKGVEFALVDRSEKELVFPCPQFYTLPELVFDAYRFHQITPGDALAGLEELFAGVDLGQGRAGLISSPFGVSSQNMQSVFSGLGEFVAETYGDKSQLTKEFGDGVILPVNPSLKPEDVQLSAPLAQLYELVWARSVASQMKDSIGCDRKIMFEVDGKRIQFTSLTLVQDGFLAVFRYGYEGVFAEKSQSIFREGDSVTVTAAVPQQVKSQGMAHYQISSLCEDMREVGFDDEKQILMVLQQLLDQNYVMLGGAGEIICTETLLKVSATVDRAFPGMKGLNLPAYYGQTLDELMSGRKRVDVALKQFDQNLIMQGHPLLKVKMPVSVPKIKRKSKNVIKGGTGAGQVVSSITEGFSDFNEDAVESPVPESSEGLDEILPSEAVAVVEEEAVPPDVVADAVKPDQSVVPDVVDSPEDTIVVEEAASEESVEVVVDPPCEDVFEQSLPLEEDVRGAEPVIEPVDVSSVETKDCPECGRPMVVKDDRFGKFWSCTGMPACHHSETYQGEKKDVKQAQSCPVCKRGTLSVNRTPAGKDMYVCNDPVCEFMAWAKPHAIDCPLCGSPFLVQKKDRMGTVSLSCPMAGCSYVHGGVAEGDVPAKSKKKKVRVRRKKSGSGGGKKRRVVRRKKK